MESVETSPSGAVEVDLESFPIVVMTVYRAVEDVDLPWMIKQFEGLFARQQRYAFVTHHAPRTSGLSIGQARELAKFQNAHTDVLAKYNVCNAVVLQSRRARGAFGAYQWLAKSSSPQLSFSSLADAIRWVKEMLELELRLRGLL